MITHRLPRRRQWGVSLIEAVVAMAVMALGMLAVVGLQGTMRGNGDLSRQRAEAVRIAQEYMETWRSFIGIDAGSPKLDFREIVDVAGIAVVGTNASYSVALDVTDPPISAGTLPSPPMKVMKVTVSWTDRQGQAQQVQLNSALAANPPELQGSLVVRPKDDGTHRVAGRHPGIPRTAHDLGDGTSVFKPPQPGGGTVAWVFNNSTGVIQGVCVVAVASTSASLSLADVAGCNNNTTAQLLSGYVRFAGAAGLLADAEAEAEAPTGDVWNLNISLTLSSAGHPLAPVCFDDGPDTEVARVGRTAVAYYCAIFANAAGTWGGRSRVVPVAFSDTGTNWRIVDVAGAFGDMKVCRYTPLANDGDASSKSKDHPLDYVEAGIVPPAASKPLPLTNQNFLVISADFACPTDAVAAGDLVNSNTRLHQNGIAPYTN